MKLIQFLSLLIYFCSGVLVAQTITRSATVTAGGTLSGGSNQLSFTIGQLLNTTLIGGTTQITQGFQQPGEQLLTGTVTEIFCAGSALDVPYSAIDIGGGNTFTAQLSDALGSFSNPVNIGTLEGNSSGTISAVIPNTTIAGNGYRIRVISSSPFLIGTDNGTDISIIANQTWYLDADADGFGDAAVSVESCTGAPAGYVADNTDCDDTIAGINPGQPEVLYDGVDNNCDGQLDEGFQITANMVNCGTTLSSISSLISCVSTPGVNGYRFEITNIATNAVQTIEKPNQFFSLTEMNNYSYATTYSVRVMVRKTSTNTFLGYYGPACLYSTPPVTSPTGGAGSAQLQTYCGETLPSLSTIISTTSLPGATGYRFRVTNNETGEIQTVDRTLHWFTLTMLNSYHYGTTYTVDVAVKTTAPFPVSPEYGAPCSVTSPAIPSLVNQCDTVIPTKGTLISTVSLNRATLYRFEVTRWTNAMLTDVVSVATFDKSLNRFTLNDLTNYAPNTTYSVRVTIMTSGTFPSSATPGQFIWGDSCVFTSPAAAREMAPSVLSTKFAVIGYPNPYDYEFGLQLESSSDSKVTIKVYDMIGKLIDQREVSPTDMPVQSIGERFPSGVYNVVVSQDGEVKSLRMIKR